MSNRGSMPIKNKKGAIMRKSLVAGSIAAGLLFTGCAQNMASLANVGQMNRSYTPQQAKTNQVNKQHNPQYANMAQQQ